MIYLQEWHCMLLIRSASSAAVIKAGPSTIFTTIPISSTFDRTPGPLETSAASEPEHMSNNANIMLPSNKLFPLGVVVVILGGEHSFIHDRHELIPGLVMLILSILLIRRCSKQRRQRRLGDRILSISSDIGNAPYPFDAKAYDDDIESRYPTMPTNSPPRLAPVVGIASSFPSQFETEIQGRFDNTIKGEYTQTVRARTGVIHDRPDTFTCAMYPAGTCPIEREFSTNTPIITDRDRGGSPVPSFNTGRLDDQPTITTHQNHVGKLLTPPQPPQQPKYKSKHVPAPLMISPSINEGTNSVRGFTPRKSTISVGSAYTGI